MRAPERLETERLLLRKPRLADAENILKRYASDPDVVKCLSWPRHQTLDATRAFLEFSEAEWLRAPAGPYLIESRDRQHLLGSTGLAFETPYRAATGFVLARDAWGQGYATESLRAMIDVARSVDVVRLYALCHVDHTPSSHVLEKCGFAREGVLRRYESFPNLPKALPADVACYALILK